MSNTDLKAIASILFWWNVGVYRNLPEDLLDRIQEMYHLYFNFNSRTEALKLTPAVRDAVEDNLSIVNEILIEHEIQDDNIAVFSMLYYFCEYFIDRTNNAQRRVRWGELLETIVTHPLNEEVESTKDYEYLERVEKAFWQIQKVINKVNIRDYFRKVKPIQE